VIEIHKFMNDGEENSHEVNSGMNIFLSINFEKQSTFKNDN